MPKGVYPRTPIEERFWSKVLKTESCWIWQGTTDRRGYGHFAVNSHPVKAHRFAYELVTGPIPDGAHLMHSCDNPPCVKPAHLSLGNNSLNMQDSVAKGRHWQTRKTHCKNGHLFDEANTRIAPSGQRHCRACDRGYAAKRRKSRQ